MFDENDIVSLVKQNGDRVDNFKAFVQPKLIFISNTAIPIEENDIIERKLPNGLVERYVVIDRGYYDVPGFDPHYQCKVKKEGIAKKATAATSIVYNLYGHNSKVNIDSNDNSVFIVRMNQDEIFNKLEAVVRLNVEDSEEILDVIREMKNSSGKPSFIEKYQEFIGLSANIMTIVGPFLPALSQLIK